jgi:hypothetical protein
MLAGSLTPSGPPSGDLKVKRSRPPGGECSAVGGAAPDSPRRSGEGMPQPGTRSGDLLGGMARTKRPYWRYGDLSVHVVSVYGVPRTDSACLVRTCGEDQSPCHPRGRRSESVKFQQSYAAGIVFASVVLDRSRGSTDGAKSSPGRGPRGGSKLFGALFNTARTRSRPASKRPSNASNRANSICASGVEAWWSEASTNCRASGRLSRRSH